MNARRTLQHIVPRGNAVDWEVDKALKFLSRCTPGVLVVDGKVAVGIALVDRLITEGKSAAHCCDIVQALHVLRWDRRNHISPRIRQVVVPEYIGEDRYSMELLNEFSVEIIGVDDFHTTPHWQTGISHAAHPGRELLQLLLEAYAP